jgi:hypothetical protein
MFKDTCLESLASKYTAKGESDFLKSGVGYFRHEAINVLESHYAETIKRRTSAIQWQQPSGIDWSREPLIGKVTEIRAPVIHTMTEQLTVASQILSYVGQLHRAIQKLHDEYCERDTLSSELATYGVYSNPFPQYRDSQTLEELRKMLEDAKRSDSEIVVVRNNEWAMDRLADGEHAWRRDHNYVTNDGTVYLRRVQDGTVVETVKVSPILMRRLALDIQERKMKKKIDLEARKRIAQEKAQAKKREEEIQFEEAVRRRMMELRQ